MTDPKLDVAALVARLHEYTVTQEQNRSRIFTVLVEAASALTALCEENAALREIEAGDA